MSVDAGLVFGEVIIEMTGGSQPFAGTAAAGVTTEEIRRRTAEAQAVRPKLQPQPQRTVSSRRTSE